MIASGGDPFAKYENGQKVGSSDWLDVSQSMIDQFGHLTRDPDPMHIDPEWARKHGPFGGAIAFGFLTVSMLTYFLHEALGTSAERHDQSGFYLNYGFDRLRLISPVPAGSRMKGHFTLIDRKMDAKGRFISRVKVELEVEDSPRPAMVAVWLAMWVNVNEAAAR